ncbi:MAG: metallophosphoesterase, partial [Nannocystaceae bacterium]|nr:metallophosphoesterase [Nannocystaceae bacterium]
ESGAGDNASAATTPTPDPGSSGTASTAEPTTVADSTATAASTGSESSDGGGKPQTGVVRFIAMGDGGEGNDHQYAVAAVAEQVCEERGCEFALYLGDNFYDSGVTSVLDTQFTDKFEMPYADLDFPFYIALGNHDYDLLGNAWWKASYQIAYTLYSDKWTMPSEYYSFEAAHVTFIGLDTARLFWNHEVSEQRDFLQDVVATNKSRFTVAFGHHPYISNGEHGNAGNYEGFPLPIIGGQDVKDFFDDEICGQVTVYICGHDHTRQWFPTTCGTEFLVAGAAAKTTDFVHRDDNPEPYFEDDTTPGFAWIEIADESMTVAWYDETGVMNYENTIVLPE